KKKILIIICTWIISTLMISGLSIYLYYINTDLFYLISREYPEINFDQNSMIIHHNSKDRKIVFIQGTTTHSNKSIYIVNVIKRKILTRHQYYAFYDDNDLINFNVGKSDE